MILTEQLDRAGFRPVRGPNRWSPPPTYRPARVRITGERSLISGVAALTEVSFPFRRKDRFGNHIDKVSLELEMENPRLLATERFSEYAILNGNYHKVEIHKELLEWCVLCEECGFEFDLTVTAEDLVKDEEACYRPKFCPACGTKNISADKLIAKSETPTPEEEIEQLAQSLTYGIRSKFR